MAAMGLYRPDEFLDVPDWNKFTYGTTECPPQMANVWRLALTEQLMSSFPFFAANMVYVADKGGQMTLMKPFAGQALLDYTIDCQIRNDLPGRVAEAKVRQLGWTMRNIARGLHYCLDENRRTLLLVDDEDVAAEQGRRLGTMLNGLAGFMQPMRRIQNIKHFIFDNPNQKDRLTNPGLDSAYQITVPSSMRGIPQGLVIISEYAHMLPERQLAVQTGVISAAPLSPFSIIIIDTTPNGFDDSYYPLIMEAIEDNPKWTKRIENWKGELTAQDVYNGCFGLPDAVAKGYPGVYVPALWAWHRHEEYDVKSKHNPLGEIKRPFSKEQRDETESTLGKLSKYGGEEETHLRDKYGVSTSRLFWRRRKIDGYKVPTEEMKLLTFRQEFFGSTIQEAFIDSGSAPFDRSTMDAMGRQERIPAAVGLFESENKFAHWESHGEAVTAVRRDRNQWQEIRVFAGPQNGERYTMGVDTDIAYESPDSDATVAQVVRFSDNKIVATYEARVPSYLLLEQLYCLYRWYNNCYYAIETQGIGYDLVRRCIDRGMNNVHYYKRYDKDYPEPTSFPGWETKANTRPLMDQTFTELFCHRDRDGKVDPLINIPDAKTQKEIRGLTRTPSGSFKSSRGHDDHYDALTIALVIARDMYSGLRTQQVNEEQDRKKDFERAFTMINSVGAHNRNRPDLSRL